MTTATGATYEGQWSQDRQNGQGTLTYPSGVTRSGLWRDGDLVEMEEDIAMAAAAVEEKGSGRGALGG